MEYKLIYKLIGKRNVEAIIQGAEQLPRVGETIEITHQEGLNYYDVTRVLHRGSERKDIHVKKVISMNLPLIYLDNRRKTL